VRAGGRPGGGGGPPANGWIDRERVIAESVLGIVRAGADTVLTYWARDIAEGLG